MLYPYIHIYIYDIPKPETVKLTSNMYAYVHNYNRCIITYDYKLYTYHYIHRYYNLKKNSYI